MVEMDCNDLSNIDQQKDDDQITPEKRGLPLVDLNDDD